MQIESHFAPDVGTASLRAALAATARQHSAEIVDLTKTLVRIPSAYPPGDTHAVAAAIAHMFEGVEVDIEHHGTLPHVMNLVIRIRGAKPGRRLVFNGHLDTFPLVNAAQWTSDPDGEVRDGKLYGLGVSDMKGGVAAIIFAMRQLAMVRDGFAGEVVATFAGDEESMGMEGSGYLLDNVPHAGGDAMICADAGSPQILRFGEKGMIWLRLDATGKSAHAAHVHKGDSAIEKLLDTIQAIKSIRDYPVAAPQAVLDAIAASTQASEALSGKGESDVLRGVTVTFGTVNGGRLSNLIADEATATADIRLPVGVSVAEIEATLNRIVSQQPGVTMSISRRYEASWTSPDHEVITLLKKQCTDTLGITPVVNMRVGASDSRHYRRHHIPTVVCGLTSYNMGSADEHVYVEELCRLGEIFALSAFDYLNHPAAV